MVDDYVDNPVYSKARAQIDKAKEAHNLLFVDSKITLVWGPPTYLKTQNPYFASTTQMGLMSWRKFELEVMLVPANGIRAEHGPVYMSLKARYAPPLKLDLSPQEVLNVVTGVVQGCSLGIDRTPDDKIAVTSVLATVYVDNVTGEILADMLKNIKSSYSAVESQIRTGKPRIDYWAMPGPWMEGNSGS